MKRMRKKYLVYKKDGEGERELVGIFSSGRKAAGAVRADCSRMRASLQEAPSSGVPFIERTGTVTRLVLPRKREISYSIEILCEDVEIIK